MSDIPATNPAIMHLTNPEKSHRVDRKEQQDAEIARRCLDELRDSPRKIIRGDALENKMRQWLS